VNLDNRSTLIPPEAQPANAQETARESIQHIALSFDSTMIKMKFNMETFNIRDLRERTGDLVRTAESGRLSIVTKYGHPVFVAVPLNEHAPTQGLSIAIACRLFADKVLRLGKAARMANISVESFIGHAGDMGIPSVDYSVDELNHELELLGKR
jgi:antitoxin (DNA-binding transcriptional repressor) of toxin-antitoxin stability system